MSYAIETSVPPPSTNGHKHRLYPFPDMKVGDSFFIEDSSKHISVMSAAARFKSYHPEFNFTTRKEGGGIRVWRIAKTA